MAPGETGLLTRNPWVARRALTVSDYHRMGEVGILTDRDRVELIEGELIAMSPIGSEHAGTVNTLTPSARSGSRRTRRRGRAESGSAR
jgi:hypothetical protein